MEVKSILIVKLGAVGDVVHTLYALKALRESFPNARIGWVIEEKSIELVRGNPDVDELILFPRRRIEPLLKNINTFSEGKKLLSQFAASLKSKQYEVAIDFQTLFKSGWIAKASGAKTRVGFDKWRELNKLFTNVHVDASERAHAVEKYLKLVEAIGAKPSRNRPTIYVPHDKAWKLERWLSDYGYPLKNFGVLNPSANWLNKMPEMDTLAEAAIRITQETKMRWLIIWGSEVELARAQILEEKTRTTVARIAPQTDLKELYHLLSCARIYLGTDSGPMHMAALAKTPVVAVFGPSDPKRVAPYDVLHKIVRAEGLKCLGCWKRKCRNPRCMTELSAFAIVNAALELIKKTGQACDEGSGDSSVS